MGAARPNPGNPRRRRASPRTRLRRASMGSDRGIASLEIIELVAMNLLWLGFSGIRKPEPFSEEMLALTPALSPEERENLCRVLAMRTREILIRFLLRMAGRRRWHQKLANVSRDANRNSLPMNLPVAADVRRRKLAWRPNPPPHVGRLRFIGSMREKIFGEISPRGRGLG